MTKCLIIIFSLISLMTHQSLASVCAEACRQAKNHTQSDIIKTDYPKNNCHGNNSNQPIKSQPTSTCQMLICTQSVLNTEVAVSQVKEKNSQKTLLIRGEAVVPDYSTPQQIALLDYSSPPLSQKIRLHLLFRRLVI